MGDVIELTEGQVWTVIGLIGALLVGGVPLLLAVVRSGLKAIEARFDAVDTRFDAIDVRLSHLDRDVNALMKHTFGVDRE